MPSPQGQGQTNQRKPPPKKNGSNSELSEIKQLLLSLTSDIQAVKADIAELKKNQDQGRIQQDTSSNCSGCTCAVKSATPSGPEKALNNIEARLAKNEGGTRAATLLLSKEESDTEEDEELDDDPWGLGGTREEQTPLDLAAWDAVSEVGDTLHGPGIREHWIIMAINDFYYSTHHMKQMDRWPNFQENAKTDFRYCLYGVFYCGHKDPQVAAGRCLCRGKYSPTFTNRAVRCIRVQRHEDGKLSFHWGEHIGHRPDPGRFEC